MEKIWLHNYPAGVPETVNVDRYHSLVDFLETQCQRYSELVAFENFSAQLTYHQLNVLSMRFAGHLQHTFSLCKGDRIAIMLPNVIQFPIALFGALRAGLVVVNVNPLYTARELSHQMQDSGTKAIIVLENFAHVVEQVLPSTDIKHVIVTRMGDCLGRLRGCLINTYLKFVKRQVPGWNIAGAVNYKKLMHQNTVMEFCAPEITPRDIAFLQYTGGTTGLAKGAILTHRNLLVNLHQCLEWVRAKLQHGKDTVVTALPLYHIFSLTGCFFFMAMGAKALLITNPRDLKLFINILRKHPFSVFVGLNTLFNGLMRQYKFSRIDFSHLALVISGGMALQKPVADRWLHKTNSVIIEGYGLTEASPVVTINPLTTIGFTGSVGLPVPDTVVSIRDHQGQELAINKVGELWVKGPQVMQAYWQKPDETRMVLDDDGWLRTGDIARIDERGFVYIVDRKKDMIIVSGFNVYPNEVEEVIMSNPGVQEVAVIGMPSERTGEAVKAFIVRSDADLREDDVIAFCLQRLTKYKIPKYIEFRHSLPKSNVGKVLRRALRDQ